MIRSCYFAAALVLAGCDGVVFQETSGAHYLAAAELEDPALRAVAAYEPRLVFPARVGVVRLMEGRVTSMPEAERALYAGLWTPALGNVQVVGALETQLAGVWNARQKTELQRLGVSRHLDYMLVLSYDLRRNSAEAVFWDVRSGYSYASATAFGPGRAKRNFWGGSPRSEARRGAITSRLAQSLEPDLREMITGLILRAE